MEIAETMRRPALIARFAAEPKLLLIVFALNGISYVPSLTLPWLLTGMTTEMGLSAARGGIAGTILLGTVAIVSAVTALLLRPRLAKGVGVVGGLLSLSVLLVLQLVPAARGLPALLLIGAGCGIACAGANALVAASRDPVRLNGGMWGLSVLWQILIWWVSPIAAQRGGLDGIFLVQAAATAALVLAVMTTRWGGHDRTDRERVVKQAAPRRRGLAAMLCLCALAFWARDAMAWSMLDHRVVTLGVETATLQLTLTGVSLIGFCGSLAAAALGLRFGRVATVFATQLIALVVLGLMAGADGAGLYVASLLLWSGATLFAWPYVMELAVRVDPSGRVAAMCGGLLFAGGAAGPAIAGLLVDGWAGGLLWVTIGLGGVALAMATIVAGKSEEVAAD